MTKLLQKFISRRKTFDEEVDDFYDLLRQASNEEKSEFQLPAENVETMNNEIIETDDEANPEKEEFSTIEEEKSFEKEDTLFSRNDEGKLAVDVLETLGQFVIQSIIAGVRSEDLDVSVSNDMVTIRGVRNEEKKTKGAEYLFSECLWGNFSRTIILPVDVDTRKTSAKFKNGILTIILPKLKTEKNITIRVK